MRLKPSSKAWLSAPQKMLDFAVSFGIADAVELDLGVEEHLAAELLREPEDAASACR